jgi:hypothetical protein
MDLTAMPGTPRGQHAVRNTAAAQSSPAAAEASTADKLRWALIVLRLLQVRETHVAPYRLSSHRSGQTFPHSMCTECAGTCQHIDLLNTPLAS